MIARRGSLRGDLHLQLLAELKRRNVFRMAGLYLVGAWLIVQVCATLLPVFGVPEWVMRALVALLAVGFIPAVAFAWLFELTPEGLKRDGEVPAAASIAPQTARRMDRLLLVAMALALAYFAFDKFVLRPEAAPAAVTAAPVVDKVDTSSIAVLPFVNMSSDAEQEFFSDGLSEELLNQLAQIPNLRVIARTSSFSFKGKDVDVATIAKALDVAHVLEGSVRRSGDTLRITAQLIRASDSSHLWSETYDRKLDDVFKVQDEISAEVVAALKLTLLPGQAVPQIQGTTNVQAYENYLRARALIDRGNVFEGVEAVTYLREAITLDPGYADAWAFLSIAQANQAGATADVAERVGYIDAARASARKAVELAPDRHEGHTVLAVVLLTYDRDWDGAMAASRRALELAPNDATVLVFNALIQTFTGQSAQAAESARKAVAINPLSPYAWESAGQVYLYGGNRPEAEAAFRRAIALQPTTNWANYLLGYMRLQDGDPEAALAAFQSTDGALPIAGLAMVEHTRGNREASDRALAELKEKYSAGFAFQIAAVHAWRGEKDEAFKWLETAQENRDGGLVRLRVDVTLQPLFDDPRYAALIEKVGIP